MKITERMNRISESATMAVSAEAGRLKATGVDIVAFGAGEPDFPTPTNIKQAAIDALGDNFTKYTPAGGIPQLKDAICEYHSRYFGTNYDPSECIVCVGGKHVIFNTVAALIEDGDEVVLPVPYWVTFYDVVNYHGGKCVQVATSEDQGFRLTAEAIEASLTPRSKLVIINSPNNPSGAVVSKSEFEKIHELTSSRDIMMITDECYCRLIYDSEPFSIAAKAGAKSNIIVAGSLSKTYAMTGWRVGFALAPRELISAINKLQSHATSNVTSIAQKAAIEALTGPQDSVQKMLDEYRKRRDFSVQTLNDIPGVTCANPGGAFYVYPNFSHYFGKNGINTAMDFATQLLQQAHVALVPGEAFGTSQHVRLSYATSMNELDRGISRIRDFVTGLA